MFALTMRQTAPFFGRFPRLGVNVRGYGTGTLRNFAASLVVQQEIL